MAARCEQSKEAFPKQSQDSWRRNRSRSAAPLDPPSCSGPFAGLHPGHLLAPGSQTGRHRMLSRPACSGVAHHRPRPQGLGLSSTPVAAEPTRLRPNQPGSSFHFWAQVKRGAWFRFAQWLPTGSARQPIIVEQFTLTRRDGRPGRAG